MFAHFKRHAWDVLSGGFVWCVLVSRFLAFLNGTRLHCAAFASVFPLLPQWNLPQVDGLVANHRIGVRRHPREKAFAPFLLECYCLCVIHEQ
jgi:hypothetical protein